MLIKRIPKMLFRQLFDAESSTYTYLLADSSKKAILIDPVLEQVDRDLNLIFQLGLDLIYVANTHCHADHITGSGRIKSKLPAVKSIISETSKAAADIKLQENDDIVVGGLVLKAIATPGHTEGCMSFYCESEGMVFTGDTLLIRGCGRTDFQGGSSQNLYRNIHQKLFVLPDDTTVYPAHDYKGNLCSTIAEEKKWNPRLTKTEAEFVQLMKDLNLPYPKKIDASLPANMVCGINN